MNPLRSAHSNILFMLFVLSLYVFVFFIVAGVFESGDKVSNVTYVFTRGNLSKYMYISFVYFPLPSPSF